ncbi:CaiB/BaiF CoA transferase family protein [Pseudochelatococcus sp. B33]
MNDQKRPLGGVRVVDLTHVIAGPYATQILGDLGATVTKIEEPSQGDAGRHLAPFVNGMSHYFTCFNRNKRSIALDLKHPAGLDVAKKIISSADVLVENYSPGALRRIGLGYEDIKALNPSIIYCSISGFGLTSPLKDHRYYDLIGQAYSGVMSTTGEPGRTPVKVGVPIGDTSGSLFAVISILAALSLRDTTGHGQHIDISLTDCLLAVLANYGGYYLATGKQPELVGSRHYFSVPYGAYEAKDGSVVLATSTDEQWQRFCKVLDLGDLAGDPATATRQSRSDNRARIESAIVERFATMTVAEITDRLDSVGIPSSPLNGLDAAFNSPQAQARQIVREVSHPDYGSTRIVGSPLGAPLTRDQIDAPPILGEHTVQVLEEYGYDRSEIDRLLQDNVARYSRKQEIFLSTKEENSHVRPSKEIHHT